uniref:F-box domain-containing protein n=1 Tax=Ditylenchus dipsaci TaxID=166011 RepID=A0A915DGT2_9BILA
MANRPGARTSDEKWYSLSVRLHEYQDRLAQLSAAAKIRELTAEEMRETVKIPKDFALAEEQMLSNLSESNVLEITGVAFTFNYQKLIAECQNKLVKSIQISLSKKLVLSCAYNLPLLKSHCIKGIQSMTQDERSVFFKAANEEPEIERYNSIQLRQFNDVILCPTSVTSEETWYSLSARLHEMQERVEELSAAAQIRDLTAKEMKEKVGIQNKFAEVGPQMIAILSERNVVDITATAVTFNFPDVFAICELKLIEFVDIPLSKKLVVSYAYELPLLKGHCIDQLQLMSKDYVVVFFKAAKEHPEYESFNFEQLRQFNDLLIQAL